jgi:O-antigen ligase
MLDRNKVRTSIALWIPVIWLMLSPSRPLSEWGEEMTEVASSLNRIAEGNPLERNVYIALLVLGLMVLVTRREKVVALLRVNIPIVLFFFYCALSLIWSDYPDVAFKRYIKALGDVVMIAVVVTDPGRTVALKRLLARAAFLLVPISVLLIKYYPNWGRAYNNGSGAFSAVGVTTDKNMLGVICLVCGLGSVWQILQALPGRLRLKNGPLMAHLVILVLVLWLFRQASSATSMACFVMCSTLMVMSAIPLIGRRRGLILIAMVAFISVSFSVLFLHVGTGMVESMGRDSTLSGRTDLWKQLAGMNPNAIVGSGFESFWLGPRLDHLWTIFQWKPNEAHNGYLEVFLNLGAIGVFLLGLVIVIGCRNTMRILRRDPEAGRIRLAFFLMGIIYSFTEAGFRMLSPIWMAFLLAVTVVPVTLSQKRTISHKANNGSTDDPVTLPRKETVLLNQY